MKFLGGNICPEKVTYNFIVQTRRFLQSRHQFKRICNSFLLKHSLTPTKALKISKKTHGEKMKTLIASFSLVSIQQIMRWELREMWMCTLILIIACHLMDKKLWITMINIIAYFNLISKDKKRKLITYKFKLARIPYILNSRKLISYKNKQALKRGIPSEEYQFH